MLDYRDKLALDAETVASLDGLQHSKTEPPEIELRECAILNVVAAHMVRGTPTRPGGSSWPSAIEVQEEGLKFRKEMLAAARIAESALGEVPGTLTQAEADLRVFCHDLTRRDHDKDYRMYAALPPDLLKSKALGAIRVDYYGRAAAELIVGAEFTRREEDILWVLIHKGHMRALVPPKEGTMSQR